MNNTTTSNTITNGNSKNMGLYYNFTTITSMQYTYIFIYTNKKHII